MVIKVSIEEAGGCITAKGGQETGRLPQGFITGLGFGIQAQRCLGGWKEGWGRKAPEARNCPWAPPPPELFPSLGACALEPV